MEETINIPTNMHSIKLTRGMNGNYGWEIKIYFDDLRSPYKVIEDVEKIDIELKTKFKVKETKK